MGNYSQQITIVGNLVEDPELRFTPSGHAVVNCRVVVSDRKYDKTTNEWKDGDPWFISCNIWRDYAEHVAESLVKGARVVVTGHITQRQYENKEGVKVTVIDLAADEIAVSLKFCTAKIQKMQRSGGATVTTVDPWATTAETDANARASAAAAGAVTDGGFDEEPPF